MKLLWMLLLLTITTKAFAFDWNIHRSITVSALTSIGFSSKASYQVAKSNIDIDRLEAKSPATHVDSEAFEAASALMRSRLRTTALLILSNDMDKARVSFGHITHTVQDFYSHTTYIEFMKGKPIDLMNLKNPLSSDVCSKDNFKNKLTSGYYPDSSTPLNKCSHSTLNKDSGNFSSKGAEAIEYATQATINFYDLLVKEVMSLNLDQDKSLRLMSDFKDSKDSLSQPPTTEINSNKDYIYYGDRYKIIPFAGLNSYQSNTLKFESNYSTGVKGETRITDNLVMGVGFTINKMDLVQDRLAYDYSNYGLDFYTKFFIFSDSRFQPFLGAGINYERSNLVQRESSISHNLNGELLGGMNLMFTNLLGISFETRFIKTISPISNSNAYAQSQEQLTLENLRNQIDNSDRIIISAGMVISF